MYHSHTVYYVPERGITMLELRVSDIEPKSRIETAKSFIRKYSLDMNEYELEYYLLGKYSRKDALKVEKQLVDNLMEKFHISEDRAYEIIGQMRKSVRK